MGGYLSALAAVGCPTGLASSTHMISACLFGGIKTSVGGADQVIPHGAMILKGSDSRADSDGPRHSRKLPLLDGLPKVFSYADGMFRIRLRQQHFKLLSSITASHFNRAHF